MPSLVLHDMLRVMKNKIQNNQSVNSAADDIFADFGNDKGKGIFARIPGSLHREVLEIKADTGKSLYEIVEKSLKLFVAEYKSRKAKEENSKT